MPSWIETTKRFLGALPYTPELYYWLYRRRTQSLDRYNLERLDRNLPALCAQASAFARTAPAGKRIFIFASIYYWIEHCAVVGMALAGQGHRVTLGYFPYSDYRSRANRFDQRYRSFYTRTVLRPAREMMESVNLLGLPPASELPQELQQAVETISLYDTQYVLQIEEVQAGSEFYRMRFDYNDLTARTTLTWLRQDPPDLILIPNGIVIEYGVAYQVAHHLGIPVVTFEFSEDREQLWLAHDDEVIRQNTDALWQACRGAPLTAKQRRSIRDLEDARQSARAFGRSDRLWQDIPPQGQAWLRKELGLDQRPVVLLATNVLGDSLILGRDIFSQSMADWIARTIHFFAGRSDRQLVIRVHPGERFMKGPSMVDVIRSKVPQLPENVHVVGPLEKINTYDIMGISQLGLVYTTTTGMEMVMNGVPVIVAGDTHYRGRGFTLDPRTWEEYFSTIEKILARPERHRPTPRQVDLAWNYAYRFFFQYSRPFPWHLYGFWESYQAWPLERVLGEEGRARFGATFRALAGEPIQWTDWEQNGKGGQEGS